VEGSRVATAAPNSSPEGLAPVRHHLGVESLEPGLYQLVITGPESTYWVEQFTPSTRVLEEDDAASQPRAAFDVEPADPVTEAPVTVEATAATDGDGTIETYEWRFGAEGEGRTVTTRAATATHTFHEPGEYPVALTVTDDDGNADTVTRAVSVAPAPAGDTGVRLDTARRTTGDCVHVDDNRLPSERSTDEADRSPAADDPADSSEEEFEEFEEEGLYCTVYDPEPPRLEAGERIRYDVVVADANTGIDAAAFTVEVSDGSVADVTDVTLGPDATTGREADVRLPADTVTVTDDDLRERLGDARGRTVVATITVEAERGGTTDLVLSDADLRNPRGDAYTVTSETGAALAVADRGPPPLGDGARGPTDPDGDGRYEDVNGNGVVTLADVTLLFADFDDDAVTDHPDAFDFNDNGRLSLADVTRLFEAVQQR
jgi:PKD repeat protein